MLIVKHRGDSSKQTTQRKKIKIESKLSALFIFAFEEQSCLILDSIFNPLFTLQILDSICRFHSLGCLFFILNWMNIARLNRINTIKTNLLKWGLNWLLNYANSENCYILACHGSFAKLNKEMQASLWKIIIKNQQQKPLTPSVKLNQRIQSLIIFNAENKLGHLT